MDRLRAARLRLSTATSPPSAVETLLHVVEPEVICCGVPVSWAPPMRMVFEVVS
jgi:hypothetical protein